MSEKILYSDLFEEDILAKIGELSKGIQAFQGEISKIKKAIQGEAIELKIQISRDGLNNNQIQVLANNIDKLSKGIKILNDAQLQASKASVVAKKALQEQLKTEQQREKLAQQQQRTEQQRAKQQKINKDLSKEEQHSLAKLQEQINQMIQAKDKLQHLERDEIKYQDVKQQSLNMLTQTYNTLVSALKKFSAEEKSTIPVLAEMQKQAKALRVEISNQNKEIGNYTLNVGNYQSAFDGLGWSVRNVVRELPALGINLNSFFLAISNNIPIVIDEIKRFNEEQKKVAEAIANGTAEAGTQVQSVGKKIISTVLSWQTLLIVGITVLTKYGKQIGEWVVGLFRAKQAVDNLISSQEALNKVKIQVLEETKDEEVELKLILSRLKDVKQGTDEWRNAIERVNEITGENLNTTNTTYDAVKDVTKAYIEQAVQLAKNQAIIDQLAEHERNMIKRNMALRRGGRNSISILSAVGESYYDENGEVTDFGKRADAYINAVNNLQKTQKAQQAYSTYLKEMKDDAKKALENFQKVMGEDASPGTFSNEGLKTLIQQDRNTITDFENWIRARLPLVDNIDELLKEYMPDVKDTDTGGGRKDREKTKKDYEDLWRELAEIRVEALKESYEKELAQEELNNKLALHDYEESLNDKKKILKENRDNGFTTKEQYQKEVANLEKQYDEIIEKQKEEHYNRLLSLRAEHEKDIAEERKKALDKEIEAIVAKYEVEEKYMRKRSRNQTEEVAKNLQIIKQIEAQRNIIEELESKKDEDRIMPWNVDELQQLDEAIIKAENTITNLKSKLTIDRVRSKENPFTLWLGDMLTQGIQQMENESDEDYGNRLREAYKDMLIKQGYTKEQAEQMSKELGIEKLIADVFNIGIDKAKGLINIGKELLSGISDIADAYVDLADAKLEAAEAGVDAAQEAYDKEQALLEAGYANSVETAWAELEEQKKIMKQAEEEKKKAQKVQLALDTAQQASSMVTAVAEVYKSFGSNPVLAGIMAGIMISSFIASKAMAMQAVNYGDGTVELLDYGGSHASGQDMPLATDRRGRTRRVEKGEAFAVFNKRAVKRHGYSKIKSIVDGINKGTYEDRALADVERNLTLGMMYEQNRVDLTKVENTLSKVAENTGKQIYRDQNGNLVEINGNVKRVYKA